MQPERDRAILPPALGLAAEGRLLRPIVAVLAAWLLCAFPPPAATAETGSPPAAETTLPTRDNVLPIDPVRAEREEWSGLAVLQMVFAYYEIRPVAPDEVREKGIGPRGPRPQIAIDQCNLLRALIPRCLHDCGCPHPPFDGRGVLEVLARYSRLSADVHQRAGPRLRGKLHTGPVPSGQVHAEIAARRPVIAILEGPERMPLHVLIVGTDSSSFVVNDPVQVPFRLTLGQGKLPRWRETITLAE